MELTLAKTPDATTGLLFAVPNTEALRRHPGYRSLEDADRAFVLEAVEAEGGWGAKSSLVLPLPLSPTRRVLVMGIPEKAQRNPYAVALQSRRMIVLLKQHRISAATVWLSDFSASRTNDQEALRRFSTEALLADYTYLRYKTEPSEGWPRMTALHVIVRKHDAATKKALAAGKIIANATNRCRDLANTPGGDMTPATLAGAALALAEENPKLAVTVLDRPEIKKLGMGGVLGVSQGSSEQPKFIILEYRAGSKDEAPMVFVGKGVTFDTGGLNLKPTQSINEMHMDMSGGAAVINAMSAIAELKLKVNVVGLVPAVENMPSGSSYRPGDVLKSITGKTIEVLNTDAEGRLILADALGYAKRYNPNLVVDVATLTGASMVALGQRVIALFTNDQALEKLGRSVGDASGDRVWPLPAWDEYFPEIQGTLADVANSGKTRYGGAITGAVFLKQFIDYPWMHLDIAPRMTATDDEYLAKGAAGAGVRFLVELARREAKR